MGTKPDRRGQSAPGPPKPEGAPEGVPEGVPEGAPEGAPEAILDAPPGAAYGEPRGQAGPRAGLARLGLAPSRARGQNFLRDRHLAARLAGFIAERAKLVGGRIVEIGPGLGAITRPLLDLGAEVVGIEFDRGLAAALRGWPEAAEGRLEVVGRDALGVDLASEIGRGPFVVCGNLPYNISTPLLFWYLGQIPAAPEAVFMLQREMAQRLAAKPGGRDYGRLTVAVSLWREVETVMEVPPEAFHPKPKVRSRVVRLAGPRPDPGVGLEALGRLTAAAFNARRKTIINNLSRRYGRGRAAAALAAAGVAPGVRAETLAPEILASLAGILEA